MSNKKYNLSMHFQTDGDFGWNLVPSGFNYDDDYNYHMDKTFYSEEEMKCWCKKFIPILIENLHTSRDYIRKHMEEAFYGLLESMLSENDFHDEYSGNYEGTYIDFECEGDDAKLELNIPNELFEEMRENDVTYQDLIEGIKYAIDRRQRLDNRRIDDQLRAYVEKNIIPKYETNKNGHDVAHIDYVTNRSLMFANDLDVDLNMVYIIAIYHDLGHEQDPKHHEILSAKMFMEDEAMKQFFTQEQREIISDAISDHRASNPNEPRTIYGKIVSSADRSTDVSEIMQRTYQYCKNKHPDFDNKTCCAYAKKHITEKFGINGYAKDKMYLVDGYYNMFLQEIQRVLRTEEEFKARFYKANKLTD